MHHDINQLRRFYYQRSLGRVVQRILRDRLTERWRPDGCKGMTVAGYGFAAPMLRPYLTSARRVTALMPAPQGGMAWPVGMPNHSVLCDETAWPVDTGSVDRLVMLHGLETSDDPRGLLDQAWRVLGPGGRMMLMVPNRAGLWAASDATPFGMGRAYTTGQIESQMRAAGFVPEWHGAAVYIPPSDRRFWLRGAQFWERTGARISSVLVAGMIMVELSKQTHALNGPTATVHVPNPLEILDGVIRPQPVRGPLAQRMPGQGAGRWR
ncbi:class I SAM-dependent methyltransferase [Paracoccus sp. (in: a-proteobacteria)]|uniref:class I SAM-dependent methyltransferase n=1 Tax=Paracoccus sp. TaxID=267 RepID=UPI0026DF742F|nr:methyltransferase domain-containing protein [Paracoccus sp. (in: a-proteobacteria)]MDO5646743.1 methyltransferase domain-containing protein [Paracoccus sp. (in: a-proteobacteria)]